MRQKLFSVKKENDKITINLFGLKIVIRRKLRAIKSYIQREFGYMWNEIEKLKNIANEILEIKNSVNEISKLQWKSEQVENTLNMHIINMFLNYKKKTDIKHIVNNAQNVSGVFYEEKLKEIRRNLKFLFNGSVIPNDFCNRPLGLNAIYLWGIKPSLEQSMAIEYANTNNIPVVIIEDSFLRSACTWVDETKNIKYRTDTSFVVDDLTCYYDATRASRLELMLNDKNLIVTDEQKQRAKTCIDRILSTHLTKYNHQPIYTPNIGRQGVKKVLVVDQSYGDMSIAKGLADDNTFKNMFQAAIDENPVFSPLINRPSSSESFLIRHN